MNQKVDLNGEMFKFAKYLNVDTIRYKETCYIIQYRLSDRKESNK